MMNNNGQFNQGSPAALMANPFSMHNPQQYPSLMEQAYLNQAPLHFPIAHSPRFYNPRSTIQTPKSEKRKQEIITCDACGIEVNSQQMMDVHIRGQKHIKKMKLKTVPVINTNPPLGQTSEITDDDHQLSAPVIASESVLPNEPTSAPIVKPPSASNDKSVLQLMNELAKFNKVNAKYDLVKETGPAHCKQFEVRLTIAEEIYTGIGTSIKRAQQVAAEQALAATSLKKPEAAAAAPRATHAARSLHGGIARGSYSAVRHSQQQQRPRPNAFKGHQQSSNEHEMKFQDLLKMKCAEITEDEHTVKILHSFVEDIERALKTVSDKITETCQTNNRRVIPQVPDEAKSTATDQTNDDPTEAFRMLKGSMKVSIIAMGLFLKTDHQYSLVLICANKPDLTLLNDICRELTIALNTQALAAIQSDLTERPQSAPVTYQIEQHMNEACLHVQCSLLPNHTIRIMLTSPVFRSENFLHLDENIRQQIAELNPDPLDMLNKRKCLEAAAEIRHSNWFTHCMLENIVNLMVLRLLRDLQYNQSPLSSLNLWCLILLVHKCQIQPANSIASLFRSVFACLSSGVLLANAIGPGIIDPCEKELVDAAAYLSVEQRLSITVYAQEIIRLIAFKQYDRVLHLQSHSNEQTAILDESISIDHHMG